MENEHLHSLIKDLIAASECVSEAARKFGETSLQAQEADAVYMAASAKFRKENHWERFCNSEGPWQPECRMYDC